MVSSSVGTAKTDFSLDIYGNLLSIKKPSGATITYNVDPVGRRIRKSVNCTLAQGFLWADELHPVAELDAAGKVVATFTYAEKGNMPSIMSKGGTDYRIISDHLGSVRMVVNNNSGAILQQLDHDPYGRVIVDTNPGFQPLGYAGGLYDRDTGLVRFGRRDYDPIVGRWTSKDPIGFAGGLNLYGCVVEDPVNLVDPDGEAPEWHHYFVNGIMLDSPDHDVLHSRGWNQDWRDFFRKFEDHGRSPSSAQIYKHLKDLKADSRFRGILKRGCAATKNYRGVLKSAKRIKALAKAIPALKIITFADDAKAAYDEGNPNPIVDGLVAGFFGGPPTKLSKD